jgi:hypothetical protein
MLLIFSSSIQQGSKRYWKSAYAGHTIYATAFGYSSEERDYCYLIWKYGSRDPAMSTVHDRQVKLPRYQELRAWILLISTMVSLVGLFPRRHTLQRVFSPWPARGWHGFLDLTTSIGRLAISISSASINRLGWLCSDTRRKPGLRATTLIMRVHIHREGVQKEHIDRVVRSPVRETTMHDLVAESLTELCIISEWKFQSRYVKWSPFKASLCDIEPAKMRLESMTFLVVRKQ